MKTEMEARVLVATLKNKYPKQYDIYYRQNEEGNWEVVVE